MAAALVIGRFQPFHKGHEYLINKALKENKLVIIAVGSSQESRTRKNPFNFFERKNMIKSCFNNCRIISCPDYKSDESWANHLLKYNFCAVYSNNERVNEIFDNKKVKVKKVKELPNISSTRIRTMIINNEPEYKKLIPKNCLKIMKEINAEKVIKECFKNN
ncbi:MAG: adenylyltransferase/cytidyltransferase family protein [Candidatus Nanoarchaeia archaeon]|jgi:nicotinamide-nucleotide adenylyltransferase